MNFEIFQIFCDLAELHSFSKTGDKHLISQSAISQQLAQLELAHKCQLLDRKKRPVELTAAGQLFYTASKEMLSKYEQFKSELASLQKSTANRINVAAIFSIGMHSLPPYTKKFIAKYPDVNVHIEYFSSSQIYEQVVSGKIDVGLVAVPRMDRNIEVYNFEKEPLMLVCSPGHRLAKQSAIDIHGLQMEKFVAFEKDVPTRILIDNILHNYNVTVRVVMEFDNIETVKRAVEINSGISILPKPAILQELANGTLISLPFSNENFVRPTGIIVRRDKTFGEAGRYLIELLRKNRDRQSYED